MTANARDPRTDSELEDMFDSSAADYTQSVAEHCTTTSYWSADGEDRAPALCAG